MAISIKPSRVGKLHKSLGISPNSPIPGKSLNKALKSTNPVLKKEAVFANNAKKWNNPGTVDRVASGKPPKQTITPVKSDRGDFGLKG